MTNLLSSFEFSDLTGSFTLGEAPETITLTEPGEFPIAKIVIENNASTPGTYMAINDFSATTIINNPLKDPIPETINSSDIPVQLTPIASGLTAPNWGTVASGIEDRLFVSDQSGIVWSIDLTNGDKNIFLDLSPRLVDLGIGGAGSFDERGLLGVAFHPDFSSNGLFYTYTSEPANSEADFSTMPEGVAPNHQSVITEWTVSEPTNLAPIVDADSSRVLMRIDQPQFNHNAGALNFGPDEFLYIALGDGGGRDDEGIGHSPQGNGQDLTNILGSLLRIDPLGNNSANGQYGIPEDNPFVAQVEIPDETFAYGFRNPFRFSFDRETGDLILGDVGQDDIEEINLVEAGQNFGWSLKEGTFFFDPNGEEPGFVSNVDRGLELDLIDPILQYDHDEGISAISGFVYRGEENQELTGQLIFGDYSQGFSNPQGRLFLGDLSTGTIEDITPDDFPFFVLGFAEDNNGEIYVLANQTGVPFDDTGAIFQIETIEV